MSFSVRSSIASQAALMRQTSHWSNILDHSSARIEVIEVLHVAR